MNIKFKCPLREGNDSDKEGNRYASRAFGFVKDFSFNRHSNPLWHICYPPYRWKGWGSKNKWPPWGHTDSKQLTGQGFDYRFSKSKPCAIFARSYCFSLLEYFRVTKSSFFHEEEAHCIVGELGSFLSDSRKRLRAAHEKTLPRRLSHGGCLAYRCLSRAAYLAQRAILQLCVQL